MSKISIQPIAVAPKLYRHFAIGTIAVALIFAVFASGGTQDAMAENQQRAAMQKANDAKFGKTKLVDNRSDSVKQSASAADFGTDSGPPVGGGFGGSGESTEMPVVASAYKMPVIIEPNEAAMARMNDDERKTYMKALQDEARKRAAKGPYIPTHEQISAIAAASAERAGPPSTE
jgi:hypothetical protein